MKTLPVVLIDDDPKLTCCIALSSCRIPYSIEAQTIPKRSRRNGSLYKEMKDDLENVHLLENLA